jgi:hypothetical protein
MTSTDTLSLSLFFPGPDVTAEAYVFRLNAEGKPLRPGDGATPKEAQDAVKARVEAGRLVAVLPVEAWPRFAAKGPVAMELCLTLESRAAGPRSNCTDGQMGASVTLPAAFQAGLPVKPPRGVALLQARPGGWLGFDGTSPTVAFVQSSSTLTPESLDKLLPEPAVDPVAQRIALPIHPKLPDRRPLVARLTGRPPFHEDGTCDKTRQLRLTIFLLEGKTAGRVLEWPVQSCAGGRATSVSLEEDGTLTVGYESGNLVTFTWSQTHFERTELGAR